MDPDDFFLDLYGANRTIGREILREQVAYYTKRQSAKTLNRALQDAGCPRFAELIETELRELARSGEY